MRQKEGRAHQAADAAQVRVRPGRQDVLEQARLGQMAVPGDPEAVTVDAQFRLLCIETLHKQGMPGFGDDVFKRNFGSKIGGEPAHVP
ncbi:hypothetical protein [Roseibium aggregatum]|uniref:hypothetical protein n=1 Tax=Roseibium aggregatum TaxID=187304 RepID=UPI002E291E61|nr:hypothetical protein [Roseibium aggregatum]